jgi:hypothetical protein
MLKSMDQEFFREKKAPSGGNNLQLNSPLLEHRFFLVCCPYKGGFEKNQFYFSL